MLAPNRGVRSKDSIRTGRLLIGVRLNLKDFSKARGRMPAVRVSGSKWFVRVDGPESFLRQKCQEVCGWIDRSKMLAVYHTGERKENPHVHFIIEMATTLQKQSFDIRIKNTFEVQKGTAYSTKLWDGLYGEGAASYMFHEADAPILCNKGFTEIDINHFKEINAKVQAVMKINNEKANTKLIGKAYDKFVFTPWSRQLKKEIFRYMMECIKNGENYHPGDFILVRYVEEVNIKLCPSNQFDNLVETKFDNLFRDR